MSLEPSKRTAASDAATPAQLHLLTPDAQYADDGVIERRVAGDGVRWTIRRERDAEALPADALAQADGLVVWHEMRVDAAFIERLERCRIIVRAGVGFDHIDLDAAGAAGLPVCNTPDYGTSEVADHAIALMLALARGIVGYHDALVDDPVRNFDWARAPLVTRLRDITCGIVGIGRIGSATALRAKALGMRVLCHDPYAPRGQEIALGVGRVETLDALLQASDVVSLHCPLTDETSGLIGAATLARMKPGAILINTARGAVVDVPELLRALRQGSLGGAALDVLPTEPPDEDDPIVAAYRDLSGAGLRGRLLLTPHAAWSSPQSSADARRLAVETAMLYLRTGRLRNLVNGASLLQPRV